MSIEIRLTRLLGGEPLAALRKRLRQRYERIAADTQLSSFRIAGLTAIEHAALAALQGSSSRYTASMQVDVGAIDKALQQANVSNSLRAALEKLDGPIICRSAEKEAAQTRWQNLGEAFSHPALASVLQTPDNLGLLKRLAKRDHTTAMRLLTDVQIVINRLPATGMTRAQLAAIELGDAHALDNGRAVATLVLTVLRSALNHRALSVQCDDGAKGPSDRELWASAGVLVNELARPALVLNLPGLTPLGEPAYLSLRSLVRAKPEYAVRDRNVYVCENPNLLAIAADQLGSNCAPMVCTDGMPSAAQRTLLNQLTQAGATLHYHGDFDWPGITIGNYMFREHNAQPWRFSAVDYTIGLGITARHGRPLKGVAVYPLWDRALAVAMQTAKQAIDEESVAKHLLFDLATHTKK